MIRCIQLLLITLLCYNLHIYAASRTDISIFYENTRSGSLPKNNAIFCEFAKTMQAGAEHIFVSPCLWRKYCSKRKNEQSFLNNWDLYDTHVGMLYLKRKGATNNMGIKEDRFTRIDRPFKYKAGKNNNKRHWTQSFHTLFDLHVWNQFHASTGNKKFIYMNGHGSRRGCHFSCEMACGIRASYFADLLKFFNDKLKIDLIGVQSCYWTSNRIFNLMKKRFGYNKLNFSIITPLRSEKVLYLGWFRRCRCHRSSYYCFFEGLKRIIDRYTGAITREIKSIVNNIDTLKIRKNKNQCATMITAGTQQTNVI